MLSCRRSHRHTSYFNLMLMGYIIMVLMNFNKIVFKEVV